MSLEKLPLAQQQTVEIRPNGPLKGHTFVMAYPSTALYLKVRGDGALTNDDLLEAVLAAVVDDSVPGGVTSLSVDLVLGLFEPWMNGWMETVLPPPTGRRSRKPSPSSP